MDSKGKIYASMTQVNTDTEVFGVFVTKLLIKMKIDDPKFAQNYIFLLDNAKYHKTEEMLS